MPDIGKDTRPSEGREASARTEATLSPRPSLWLKVEEKLGLLEQPVVMTFASHGGRRWLRVKGRVVEATSVEKGEAEERGSLLQNAWATFRRLESDEIPGARIRAEYRGARWESVSDEEGYFSFRLEPEEELEEGWHRVPLKVEVPLTGDELEAEAPVYVPSPGAAYAVISDVDDTVIATHATDLWGEIKMVFGESVQSRPPFPGVAALYRALARGPDGGACPVFYVSLSGWNLYDFLAEFLEYRDIPMGPFFMQDLGVFDHDSKNISHDAPKLERAAILMENYPELPFILIGDSGQHDAENYRRVVDRHPGRVKAIYIRDVTPDEDTERDRGVQAIAEEVRAKDVHMLLVRDSLEIAEHLRDELDLLDDGDVEEVRRQVERERAQG